MGYMVVVCSQLEWFFSVYVSITYSNFKDKPLGTGVQAHWNKQGFGEGLVSWWEVWGSLVRSHFVWECSGQRGQGFLVSWQIPGSREALWVAKLYGLQISEA